MKLNELRDNPGATKNRIRVGRGTGSGKGKTSGRGVKGQKARTGVSINGFEGGQMPLFRRLPKRGFNNPSVQNFSVINLDQLQAAIDAGTLDAKNEIDAAALKKAGLIGTLSNEGVRLLGKGTLKAKVTLKIAGASSTAKEAVEKAGGSLTSLVTKKEKGDRKPKKTQPKKAKGETSKARKAKKASATKPAKKATSTKKPAAKKTTAKKPVKKA
jgi:large subunit ribosomal protein L15